MPARAEWTFPNEWRPAERRHRSLRAGSRGKRRTADRHLRSPGGRSHPGRTTSAGTRSGGKRRRLRRHRRQRCGTGRARYPDDRGCGGVRCRGSSGLRRDDRCRGTGPSDPDGPADPPADFRYRRRDHRSAGRSPAAVGPNPPADRPGGEPDRDGRVPRHGRGRHPTDG